MTAPAESEPLILPAPSPISAHLRDGGGSGGGHEYSQAGTDAEAQATGAGEPGSVPMSQLTSATSREFGYPPANAKEADEERVQKRRDDFEGWNENWSEGEDEDDDEEEEQGEEEVLKRRLEREGPGMGQRTATGERSWGRWWQKEM